jgi:hypothetical protein
VRASAAVRTFVDGKETRVLKPDGVPYGSIVSGEGGATVFDAASRPIALVEPRDNEEVIRRPDGAVKHFVIPSSSAVAAGAFALEALPLADRAALYLSLRTK